MQPGDVIAFGGSHTASNIIKWATRSTVSHTAVILQTKLLIDQEPQAGMINQIIESTSAGVATSRLSDSINHYQGNVWWLPLSTPTRKDLSLKKFYDFLLCQEHKPYDLPQAISAWFDELDACGATKNREDFSKFFCSELVAAGLEEGGAIHQVNASEVTPIDLCMFRIYSGDYVQIKGNPTVIKGYNSTDPNGFGI